ncbi:MAG: hypothetical protein K2G19_03505, partial [Lachnospiraceae bacterium]|nr:hypothetical protein [Lachnospiraceae bacterium]
TGLFFTLIGMLGKSNIYAGQEYDPVTTPALALMFRGVNDDIYPWQILDGGSAPVMAVSSGQKDTETSAEDGTGSEGQKEAGISAQNDGQGENGTVGENDGQKKPGEEASPSPSPAQETDDAPLERLAPLRESTHDEYLNHISADIYGDAGVRRAAAYEFDKVDESYFDDALFIGDSRTVGLRDYTDLSDHGDFYCETSLTIHKVMEEDFGGKGTIEDALENRDYGKIYLMVGINELGRGTTENYMEAYTEVVDKLRELEPEAKIFVQAVMRVSGEKSDSDAIFNNSNINARNNAIATLADNRQIFYIDVNEVVCDEEGNLNAEYTHDKIHLLGMYNELWKEFLLAHGVTGD